MRQKSEPMKEPADQVAKEIRRAPRRQYSAEEKIGIVLDGLRGGHNIAELCRREVRGRREAPSASWSAHARHRGSADDRGHRVGKTPDNGARLPERSRLTRKSWRMASWLRVIESRLHMGE